MIKAFDSHRISTFAQHLIIITLGGLYITSCGDSKNDTFPVADPTYRSMKHMEYLTEEIGQRIAGQTAEVEALEYIRTEFLKMGYQPEVQHFSATYSGDTVSSNNIAAVLKGSSDKEIIVGAHYDSVDVGKGYVDNASGVGLMLAMAERLRESRPPFTVRFVAFGAEEIGLFGSRYYAANMSDFEIANTIGMVNLDSIVGGDMIYAYGGPGQQGWMRDQALDIAVNLQIDLKTNPGLNPNYPEGTTGDWSDHAPFKDRGIDYLYFEATNWEIGDLTGFLQTEKFGELYHTENDDLAFLDQEYPGRIESQLGDFAMILDEFLLNVKPPNFGKKIAYDKTPDESIGRSYLRRDGTQFDL